MNLKLIPLVFCMTAGAAYADCKTNIPADTTPTQFVIGKDAAGKPIVTDNATGLVWQRCSVGQTGDDCAGTATTFSKWVKARGAAKNGWRLPNEKELLSIVDIRCQNPAIDSAVFPNTQPEQYWSSSRYARGTYMAWRVSFLDGNANYTSTDQSGFVRLVRGGQ